ncbi:MAG TPA: hypothetical protein VIT67_02640 [Povalibacter sp.]
MTTLVLEQLQPSLMDSHRKSGRAVTGERGDAIWEWQTSTGVFERDVTAEQLSRLEAPELSLVEVTSTDRGMRIYDSARLPAEFMRTGKSLVTVVRRHGLWARLRGG